MSSQISALAIDARNPRRVAEFWCAALGWQQLGDEDGIITIGHRDGSWPTIDVAPIPEAKEGKNRLHLDLRADGLTTRSELTRLLDLGAQRVDVGQDADVPWVVLADPEGNEFCLLPRTVQEARAAE